MLGDGAYRPSDGQPRLAEAERGQSKGGCVLVYGRRRGSLECYFYFLAGCRGGVGMLELIRRQRRDQPLLLNRLIGERRHLDTVADRLACLVNGVRSGVGDRRVHDGFGFLRCRLGPVIGSNLWKITTTEEDKETTIRTEIADALRICAEGVDLGAIRSRALPGDGIPGPHNLVFERLLLADRAAWQHSSMIEWLHRRSGPDTAEWAPSTASIATEPVKAAWGTGPASEDLHNSRSSARLGGRNEIVK